MEYHGKKDPIVSVRFTDEGINDLTQLAEIYGMDRCEYIRHLVALDKAEQKRIWSVRNSLFANEKESATNTSNTSNTGNTGNTRANQ